MFDFSTMNSILEALWSVTKGAWLTAALLILVRFLFRKVLSPKAKYYLWFLLALRLMLPVVPESNWSLMNFAAEIQSTVITATTENTEMAEASEIVPVETTEVSTSVSPPIAIEDTDVGVTAVNWDAVVFHIWLLGAALLVLIYLLLYLVTAIQLHRCPTCQDEETITRFRILKAKMGIHRNIRLAMGSGGMLGGLLHPTLVLPAEVYGAAAEPILVHELTHQRYQDGWLYLLLRLMTVIHWFNPAVWLCFYLARQDSELACDQRVLDSGLVPVKDYLTALVDQGLLSRRRHALMHTSFATTRKRYVARIREITRYAKKRPLALVAAVLLVAAICLFTFTGKSEPTAAQEVIKIPSDGYSAMTEVDGTLYLVDLSGNILTMDWDTGETALFCKSIGGYAAWTSDQSLSYLYYMKDDVLYRHSTSTGETESLCPLPYLLKICTVTDHYVFYRQEFGYYALNLETLESECWINSAIENLAELTYIPGAGDTLYVALNYSDRNDRVETWNLATGEKTVLYEHMNNITMVENGTVAGDALYFRISDSVYTMPVDGSQEPKAIAASIGVSHAVVHCSDDSLIFTVYAYGAKTKRYDPVTGLTTSLEDADGVAAQFAAVSGDRYAVMCNYYGSGTLVIADLPE